MKRVTLGILGRIALLTLVSPLHADARLDLSGKVLNLDEEPIKNATVFIYTAGPRIGTGSICPSCYPDCRKKAQTDSKGRFKIEALDPKLVFRLLVVGGGLQPKFVPKVDPVAGAQEIVLSNIEDDPSRVKIQGMVMNPEGQPVFGAVLSVEGVETGRSTRWGAVDRDADPVAVTDENGLFTLRCSQQANAVHALLETSSYAKRWVRLAPGNDHVLRAQDGVTVRGQLLSSKGKPVQNGVVAMATTEREAGKHLKDFEAITDENGKFAIMNVTPEREFYLFGKMESLREAGALAARHVKAGRTGTAVDLGALTLGQSHTIKGRVVLPEDEEVPPNTRLFLGRDQAWDHTETILDQDGKFEFHGVPAEPVSLSLRIKGYKLSHRNPSLDWLNGGLVGTLQQDLNDFVILLERGNWRYNEEQNEAPPNTNLQPQDLPLRSPAF